MSCDHLEFDSLVGIHRLSDEEGGPVTGFNADIRITCRACKLPFKFVGLPVGLDMHGAAVSFDREEAHLAISPDGLPSTTKVRGFRITDRSGRT